MKRCGFLALLIALAAATIPAQAARTFTIAQTAPAAPGEVDMATTQVLTFTVTNTASGANAGERIYRMRFRLAGTCTGSPCTATLFSNTSAAPANWTRTGFSTTSVTYTAATWNDAIPAGSSLSFSVVIAVGTSTQDRAETLRDARASFTVDTVFAGGITNAGTSTINTPGSWTSQSLQITGFQTTDTSGVATSSIVSGVSFRVVITVKNISTIIQNGIVANPVTPTQNRGGTWVSLATNCSLTSTNPSPFNLAAAASGTITYTCTTNAGDNGTVSFTVIDVRTGATVTSRTATSNSLVVSPLTISIATTPACVFPGDTATFTMTVTNSTAIVMNNVTPSVPSRNYIPGAGSVTIGAYTGPTTNPLNCNTPSLAVGATCNFIWTAPITGTVPASGARPQFWVTGNVTANGGVITSQTASSPPKNLSDYLVAMLLGAVNGDSRNQEITWDVTNRGCGSNLNSAAITVPAVPAGWTFGGDAYSLTNNTVGSQVETWTVAGTTFTAPNATDRIPVDQDGSFSLVFSAVPSVGVATASTFTVRVTDQAGFFVDRSTAITINPFGTGIGNRAAPTIWHEIFQ